MLLVIVIRKNSKVLYTFVPNKYVPNISNMTRYSVQPRIFVKGYGFLSFAKNMGKNIG